MLLLPSIAHPSFANRLPLPFDRAGIDSEHFSDFVDVMPVAQQTDEHSLLLVPKNLDEILKLVV